MNGFLAYLEDRESSEATQELLAIPGFEEALRCGKRSPFLNRRTFESQYRG